MKRLGNVLILICFCILGSKFFYREYSITTSNVIKFSRCPASGEVCSSNGYNLLCHMTDPIKDYNISSYVCDSGRSNHYGMDLTAKSGSKIYNAIDGIVINVTRNDENCGWTLENGCGKCSNGGSLSGNSVTIQGTGIFSGYTVQYMHLSSIDATILSYYNSNSKNVVQAGSPIGIIGNTGCSSGRHLHFQVVDPSNNVVNTAKFFEDKSSLSCGVSGGALGETSYGASCTSFVDSSSYSSIKADKILSSGRSYLNYSYEKASSCDGFVRKAYANVTSLGSTAAGIALSTSNRCVNYNDIKPGDLFFTSRTDSSGKCTRCASSSHGNRCDRWNCILHVGIVESVSSNGIVKVLDNINKGVSIRSFEYNLAPNAQGNPWLIMVTRPYA